MILEIKQSSTSERKIVRTYKSQIELTPQVFHWLEECDVEQKAKSNEEFEDDVELECVPEYSECVVLKEYFIGTELAWDQEELLWRGTIMFKNFRFDIHNSEKQIIRGYLKRINEWAITKDELDKGI